MTVDTVLTGDNLAVLSAFPDCSIDLVYLDPPFNSSHNYRMLRDETGIVACDSSEMFKDAWNWTSFEEREFNRIVSAHETPASKSLRAFHSIFGNSALLGYLVMMTPRLVELHRVLRMTGSIYLHCDTHASAYLKVLMDAIFGMDNFLNCIVWCYGLGGSSPRYYPRKHDDILWYARDRNKHYFKPPLIPASSNRMKGRNKKAPDYWFIPSINNMARERCGYPTQKPEALLERIITSSSRAGDVVLDPFCGSGTSLAVAKRLGRGYIGIDNNEVAVEMSGKRLNSIS